ncbi:MAG: thioredoxin-disulfide reductase [Spirochaetae bacterium HGW-Spirochaetae-1]|nr:MAG: thioredoxin-disulfide reductase [Spirochaetae bacterium HGW-Spirochaetae-1]
MKDLIIIGAGPGGLAASIYGIRAGLDVQVVEKFSPGGQVMNTYEVENYPGFVEPVAGWELMSKMEEQARRLGVSIENGEVSSIHKDADRNLFVIRLTSNRVLEARTAIITTGAAFKKLDVPGEKEFTGRGVSYCATCDGAFFRDKVTAVVGGGDTALEEAIFLTRFAGRVYIIHRRDSFRGSKILQDRLLANEKIIPIYDSVVESINGDMKVANLSLLNKKTGEKSNLDVDGVFIFVGYTPNSQFLPDELLNEWGEVKVDMQMRTAVTGLFAAGDIRSESKRQIVMAAADGATAAMNAYDYITDMP